MKDLNIEGKKYISTKRASELSGYTSDYIGQLSRGGFVKSTIIGKTKFVDEEELLKYIEIVKNNKLLHKNGNGNAETIKSQNHPSEIFFGFHGASKISKSEYAHENINNENKINYSTDESPLFPELKKKNFFTEISKNNGPLTRSPFLSQENFVSDTFFKKIISACLAIVVVFGPYTFLKTQYAIAGWNKIKTVAGNTLEIGKEIAQKINKDGVIILVTDSVGYTKDLLKNETRRIAINTASTILSTDVKSTQFSLKNIAKGIYLSINSLFTKTKTTETTQLVKNVETNLPIQTGKSQNPTPSPTIVQIQQPTKTIVIEGPTKIVERVLERTSVIGVSKEELEARIQQLDNKLSSKIYNVSSGTPNSVQTVYDVVSQTNRIDKLRNVEITTPTIVGGTLKDSVISNSSFSGTTISASTLTLTGNATIGGQLTVSGGIATSTIAGDVNFDTGTLFIDSLNNRIGIASTSPNATFSVNGDSYVSGTGFFGGAINSTSTITGTTLVATSNSATSTFAGGLNTFGLAIMNFLEAPFLTATSTTATSTFAGGLAIETSGLVYDYSTNNVGIGTVSPTSKLQIVGGEVRVGNGGTVDYATGDGSLYVKNILEVDGGAQLGGTLTLGGKITSNYLPTSTTDYAIGVRPTATNPSIRYLYDGATYTDVNTMMGSTSHIKYYGYNNKFTGIYLALGTLGLGYNLTAEYSKGGGVWGSVTITDNTSNLTANGNVYFDAPSDWATDSVNSSVQEYWIRLKTSTNPTINAISSSNYILPTGYAFATYLSSEDTEPKFYADYKGNVQVNTLLIAQDLEVSNKVGSNLIPSTASTYNLGTGALPWNNLYADTVTATNLVGTVVTGSTVSADWTINSDNASADTENMSVVFERGSETPNAVLSWNSTSNQFELNGPVVLTSGIGTATLTLPGNVNTTGGAFQTNSVTRLDNAGNLSNIGSYTSSVTLAGSTAIDLIGGTLTNNTTSGNQTLLSLTNAGTGTTEKGIYLNNTGTGTNAIEVAGTWTNGLIVGSGNVGIGTTSPYAKLSVVGEVVAPYYTATSTTATSTFAGGLAVETSGLVYDYSSNNVGIGTAVPANNLHVSSTANNSGINWVLGLMNPGNDQTAGVGTGLKFYNVDTARWVGITSINEGDYSHYMGMAFYTGGDGPTEKMRITNAGNVGIGTTTPSNYKLTVNGNGYFANNLTTSSIIATSTTATSTFAGGLAVETSGLVYDYSSNNVGIGTASPRTALTIGSGQITVPTGTVGAPSYSFSNDTAKGFYEKTGGGYNTIVTSIAGSAQVTLGTDNAGIPTIMVPSTGVYGWSTNSSAVSASTDLGLSRGAAGKLYIGNGSVADYSGTLIAGTIGIGTTTPYSKLSVWGSDTLAHSALEVTNSASTTLMTVLNSGNVGIGTTGPSEKLSIVQTTVGDVLALRLHNLDAATNDSVSMLFGLSSGSTSTNVGAKITGIRTNLVNNGDSDLTFSTSLAAVMTERMRILASGNVGIGTTSPYAKLSVEGTSALGNSALAGSFIATTTTATSTFAGGLAVETSGLVYDYSSNNVGIGTASPTQELDVVGDITISSGNKLFLNRGTDSVGIGTGAGAGGVGIFTGGTTMVADFTSGLLYLPNSNHAIRVDNTALIFQTKASGGESARITSAGRMGIGTTEPSNVLDVETNIGGTLAIETNNTNTEATQWAANSLFINGNRGLQMLLAGTNGTPSSAIIRVEPAISLNFSTTDTTRMTILAGGNVGIGTTSPYSKLSVAGNIVADGTITASTLTATTSVSAPYFTATSASATSTFAGGLAIETSGLVYDYSTNNVGIGTATPTALLHVSGTTIIGNSTLSQAFQFGTLGANSPALANANVTMSASNYALSTDGTSQTIINAPANIDFRIANSVIGKITATNGYFNGSGNFGIGTTSPYAKLSVVGPVVAEYFNATSTTATSTFAGGLQAGTNNALTIEGGATANSLYVKTNGNVGIGTTSPYAKLSVWGSGTGATEMANFTNSASTTVMSILNNGNVGIGTTGPTSVLHVPILSSGQTAAIGTAKFISPGDQDANGLMNAITLYNAAGTQKASIGYRQNDLGGLYIGGGNGGDTANLQFGGSQFKLNTNGGAGISFTGGDGIGFTFGFGTSALQKVNFNNDGNVGIGTTAPGEKLSVAGVIESTTGGFKFPDGTTQITASTGGIDPTTTSELMDDFIGGNTSSGTISQYGWKWTTGGSGTITYTSAESGRVGLVKGKSGTTTNNGSTLYLVDPANQPIFPSSFGNLTIIFSIKQVDANSSSNMQIGTADNIALIGDVNNGAYFRSSGSGNWYAITRSGAIETATDTGVAQASSFKQFKIVINSNYTSIAFYIDNVLKATHTTNLPSGNLSPRVQIVTTSGTDYSFDIDYFYYKATGLSRADIAENYTVEDLSIESGDLVKIKEDQNPLIGKYVVEKTSKPYDSKIMGTISTEPAMILGEKGKENLRPIALIGRVPIKVSTKNGEILAGDYLTSSDIPGVAMKSTKPGMTIGKALESYSSSSPDEIGKIMVFVNPHWSIGSVEETSTSTLGGYFSLPSEILAKISLFFNEIITKVENGIAYMKALVVDTLEIGSPTKPTGVTVYDKNGQAGCLEVQDVNNGTVSVKPGKCDQQVEAPTPDTSSGGDITPPASDTPSENTDITPPVITLNGTSPVVLIVGDIYNEEGAIVTDDVDTDIALIISGTVDTNTAGSYTITYTATDTAGNTVSTTRIVNVETTAPTPETPIEVPPETPPETLLIQ